MVTGAMKLPGTVDYSILLGFPCSSAGKESTCNTGDLEFDPRGKQNQEKQYCSLGAWSSFPIKEYTQYIWAILKNWNPTWCRKLKTACCPQHVDPRPEGWWCWFPLISPPWIRKMPMSWSHPIWTITIKLLTTLSKLGHKILRTFISCGPFWLAKK